MPTSAKNSRAERGMTLLEALVAVAILSLSAGVAAGAIGAMSPRLIVDRAADQLIVDLKRARLAAQTSGEAVRIVADEGGYKADALRLDHRFRSGLKADWNGSSTASLDLVVGLGQEGAEITLSKNRRNAIIRIEPVSGRIERVR